MKSIMQQHAFNQVPGQNLPRSVFNRPFTTKLTFPHGQLIPWYVDEIIPGDSFNVDMSIFTRLATPLYPIMDNIKLDVYAFFVPMRILWDNFEKMQGAQDNPGDSIDYTIPQIDISTHTTGSLSDYFGLPVSPSARSNAQLVNALPYRGYQKIYNEWFRDQNLINSATESTGDGPDTIGNYTVRKVAKYHDYFTSALTQTQKGDAVDIPLGTTAPVVGDGNGTQVYNTLDGTERTIELDTAANISTGASIPTGTGSLLFSATNVGLQADLSNATAATINSLRQAFAIQRLLESDMRAGTRYVEILKNRYRISNFPDARLQRPEFLMHKRINLSTSPVAQTSESGTTPQGNLAGIGVAGDNNFGFTQSFVEHGYIMYFITARADLTYQQGVPKMWLKQTRYDLYTPELANIGEQSIENQELYYTDESGGTATGTNNIGVFGYTPRYEEYRFANSRILNQFRSNATATFDPWHLSQEFGSLPTLNQTFIEENAPMTRVKATSTDPDYIMDSYVSQRCARPLPLFGVPGMGGRF